ncbi:hypothetical protein GCM10008023_02660 [Sphingomonas glacialis]|uniref:Uncharacterized protein n=1 Tax=Sphingomonas glacialis TaxID=658225 RepID=A0ABQ3L8N3_9SPHN|nr:hypothetical protein GCM10008023_02660 [Sphingomonas glacialis]
MVMTTAMTPAKIGRVMKKREKRMDSVPRRSAHVTGQRPRADAEATNGNDESIGYWVRTDATPVIRAKAGIPLPCPVVGEEAGPSPSRG